MHAIVVVGHELWCMPYLLVMDLCKPTPVYKKINSVLIALNLVQVMGINNSVWVSHMHNYMILLIIYNILLSFKSYTIEYQLL